MIYGYVNFEIKRFQNKSSNSCNLLLEASSMSLPSELTSCSSGMDFSPPQSHVFLNTRSLSRLSAHDIDATDLSFSKSENLLRLFLTVVNYFAK